MATNSKNYMSYLNNLEEKLNEYFNKKAPALPKKAKEIIVKIAPWLVLIEVILSIPTILSFLGLGMVANPYLAPYTRMYGATFIGYAIFWIIEMVLVAMAFPGLKNRQKKGWNFIFYSTLVGFVPSALYGNLFSLVIGALISFYILFQIREYYK